MGEGKKYGAGQSDNSSDNGNALCKISESGLGELSIVQSDALYESEQQNDNVKEYEQRIKDKMKDKSNMETKPMQAQPKSL
jgi:hypothetical protein